MPVIYKYDPRDNNGLPLVIKTDCHLVVFDPSNSNYEITQNNNGYHISTYQYDDDKLFSTTRNAPVMIWNTKDKKIFESNITDEYSYNKKSNYSGSLNTLIDRSTDSRYFRRGIRHSASILNGHHLVGTNTHLTVNLPEHKPFYFFTHDNNYDYEFVTDIFNLLVRFFSRTEEKSLGRHIDARNELAPRLVDLRIDFYIIAMSYFLLLTFCIAVFSPQFYKAIKRKALPLVLMRSVDALNDNSFGEKYIQDLATIRRIIIDKYFGFNTRELFEIITSDSYQPK